jgi:acetylornithine deacetylase/succinyl-diaminopimelate desuccinylase-like protein
MSITKEGALKYVQDQRERFLEDLKELCRIASVSADPECKDEMQRAAEWLADHMRRIGIDNVTIYATDGHPLVYGEKMSGNPDAPTALVYGHYDAQPAEPLELWNSPPFEPAIQGEYIYARAVTDMKGQVMAFLNAVEAILKVGDMPVNLKFILEGEEEIGSPSLPRFIRDNRELLACDFAINPDTGMISTEIPTITYALRGMAYFEVRLTGPDHDLHSGVFGGIVHNPAQVLCELIAGMHDKSGRITLPGFYDKVRSLEADERFELARLPIDEEFYLVQSGAPALFGEEGYTPSECTGARPTLEVNGLLSGYTGVGAKTVLPSGAMAKISMRLVPDQDPDEVHQQLLKYLKQNAPKTVKWEVVPMVGGPASISDRNSEAVQALARAMEMVWCKKPVFKREGGSVPVVSQFKEILQVESVNTGFSTPGDNMHSPNEKMHLPTWYRGIETFVHYFYELAAEKE